MKYPKFLSSHKFVKERQPWDLDLLTNILSQELRKGVFDVCERRFVINLQAKSDMRNVLCDGVETTGRGTKSLQKGSQVFKLQTNILSKWIKDRIDGKMENVQWRQD